MTTVDSQPRRVTVDRTAGQLPAAEAERVQLSIFAVLLVLFVLTLMGMVPTLPTSAGSSQAVGPAVKTVTDGLPDSLAVSKPYDGTVQVTLPKHWYDGTKAVSNAGTDVSVYLTTETVGSTVATSELRNMYFRPEQGRTLRLPIHVQFSGQGDAIVTIDVDLGGTSTYRQNDRAEFTFTHDIE